MDFLFSQLPLGFLLVKAMIHACQCHLANSIGWNLASGCTNTNIDTIIETLALNGIRTLHARGNGHKENPFAIHSLSRQSRNYFWKTAVHDCIDDSILLLIGFKSLKSSDFVSLIIHTKDNCPSIAVCKSDNRLHVAVRFGWDVHLELQFFRLTNKKHLFDVHTQFLWICL